MTRSCTVYIHIYIYRMYGLLVPGGPPVNVLRANVRPAVSNSVVMVKYFFFV